MRERAQCFNNDWKEGEKDIGGLESLERLGTGFLQQLEREYEGFRGLREGDMGFLQ